MASVKICQFFVFSKDRTQKVAAFPVVGTVPSSFHEDPRGMVLTLDEAGPM